MECWSVVYSVTKKANRIAGLPESHDDSLFLARLDLGKDVHGIYSRRQCTIIQENDFFSSQNLRLMAQHLACNGSCDMFVVARNHLQCYAEVLQLLYSVNNSGFSRIEKDKQPEKSHFSFTLLVNPCQVAEISIGNSERAKTLATQGLDFALDPVACIVEATWASRKLDCGTHIQQVVDCALRNH